MSIALEVMSLDSIAVFVAAVVPTNPGIMPERVNCVCVEAVDLVMSLLPIAFYPSVAFGPALSRIASAARI